MYVENGQGEKHCPVYVFMVWGMPALQWIIMRHN